MQLNDCMANQTNLSQDPKPQKVQKEATASKVAPAKKPKAKKSAEGASKEQPKLKAQKTSKAAKGEGATQKKGAKVSKKPEGDAQGDAAPPPKTTGKRGKKAAEWLHAYSKYGF